MPLAICLRAGRAAPTIICDHCRHPIAEADDGNYQWPLRFDDDPSPPIVFTHKRCCRAFEATHPLPRGGFWAWSPLEILPIYLVRGLAIDVGEATVWANLFGSI